MGSKQPRTVTTTQNTEPWGGQKPYLEDVFRNAQNLYNNYTPQYYPGNTRADINDIQRTALTWLENTAKNDRLGSTSAAFTNNLLSGEYLWDNPAMPGMSALAGSNIGLEHSGVPMMQLLADTNQAGLSPGWNIMQGFAGRNVSLDDPSRSAMNYFMMNRVPESSRLAFFADTNLNKANPGHGMLDDFAGDDTRSPAYSSLLRLAQRDPSDSSPGARMLERFAGNPVNNAGANTLQSLATMRTNAANPAMASLKGLANNNLADRAPGSDTLTDFSAGDRAGNPYMDALSSAVLARAVPSVQAQFIEGGMLSSPEAARATAAGAANAIAPHIFQQHQVDQQNQLAAANSLADRYMRGGELRNAAAGQLSDAALSGWNMRTQAADALGRQILQGRGLQQDAASDLSGAYLQGLGLQTQAGLGLGQQALQSRGLQQDAAQHLADSYRQTWGMQADVARALAEQSLQARGLQQQAGGQLSDAFFKGAGLQQSAATTLGDQWLRGAGLQGQMAGLLGQHALAGRDLQQQALQGLSGMYQGGMDDMLEGLQRAPLVQQMQYAPWHQMYQVGATRQNLEQAQLNDLIDRWNFQQNLPYEKLNNYAGLIGGNYGSTVTQTNPYFRNMGANVLGGAMGGAQLGNTLFPGIGGFIGGGLGLLSSIFGG